MDLSLVSMLGHSNSDLPSVTLTTKVGVHLIHLSIFCLSGWFTRHCISRWIQQIYIDV
jgi:hypothetical protein